MKLLYDHNLSPRLVSRLQVHFPESVHVSQIGLSEAADLAVWTFARDYGYTIVTKDSDFNDVSVLRGVPPKILWIRLGNCTTRQIEEALVRNAATIKAFQQDDQTSILEIL